MALAHAVLFHDRIVHGVEEGVGVGTKRFPGSAGKTETIASLELSVKDLPPTSSSVERRSAYVPGTGKNS
jgi:hypothetical protein